jgi:DNA-binding NtrC family response regulator
MPPLRERADDIPLLANHMLRELTGDPEAEISGSELTWLIEQSWPGNVRELRNFIEAKIALSSSKEPIKAQALEEAEETFKDAKARVVGAFERQYVTALMLRAGGNITQAARLAAIDRVYLYKLLHKHGLQAKR